MIELAVKDLKEHRVRTFLTALGIFIAITAIVSLGSISTGINELITSSENMLGSDTIFVMKNFDFSEMSGPPQSMQFETLKEEDISYLRGLSGVKRVVPIISQMGGTGFYEIDGIDMDDLDMFGAQDIQFKEGTWPENDDKGAAIGYMVASMLDVGTGDYMIIEGEEVEVFGVFEESSGAYGMAAIIPYVYAEELYDMEGEAIQVILEPEDISVVEDIKTTIEEENDDLTAMTITDALNQAREVTDTLNIMTFGIGIIASLVAAIGIIITMYTSVLERRRQMGIMKAVGAERRTILVQILEEGILLSLFASILAVVVSFFFVDVMNTVLFGGITLAIITPALATGAVAYGVLITVIFSLYPAWVAVNTDPIDAIRNG